MLRETRRCEILICQADICRNLSTQRLIKRRKRKKIPREDAPCVTTHSILCHAHSRLRREAVDSWCYRMSRRRLSQWSCCDFRQLQPVTHCHCRCVIAQRRDGDNLRNAQAQRKEHTHTHRQYYMCRMRGALHEIVQVEHLLSRLVSQCHPPLIRDLFPRDSGSRPLPSS